MSRLSILRAFESRFQRFGFQTLALFLSSLLVFGDGFLIAQQSQPPPAGAATAQEGTPAPAADEKLSPDQLDSLVAPVALYPDSLLAQTLAASTYPLELVQLQQWMAKNPNLKDKELADAVAKQPWDPSIQSMAAVPELLKRLCDDIQWTTQRGDAFLDQQSEVMDAVQRMRKKAEGKGALTSNEQQKVETKVIESKETIVIQQTNPEVVYVPSYNPTVVYPPPVYPYPPVYYPPYYPGAALVTFGVGMAMGAAIWGGSCCGCGWGGGNNTVNINNNNNFNRNTNVNRGQGGGGNRGQGGGWQHNSQHRGGAPYSSKASASKYGGSARGEGGRGSQGASARQQSAGGRGGAGASPSASSRGGGAGGGQGASSRGGGGDFGGGSRGGSSSLSGGGGGSRGSSAMGGGSGGFSGSSARSSSSRGSSSMGSRGGGGGSRGGGGGRRR
ncbi:MAG TPA: DUF3300 domain-containing protein [Thermoanaerobaculia bacterium]